MPTSALASPSVHAYRKTSVSPFHRVRFSPYKVPQKSRSLLNLYGHPHSHPDPPPPPFKLPLTSDASHFQHEGEDYITTRHVKLDFTLFKDGRQNTATALQIQAIKELFPTCEKLVFSPPFLVVVCSTLPEKPWPTTVAGLPLFLTNDPEEEPMDLGITCSGPKITIDASILPWQTPTMHVFKILLQTLKKYNVGIDRVQWIGWSILALARKAPSGDWRKTLPWTINGIRIGYVFGDESHQEMAMRKQAPTTMTRDDSIYTHMRPGVMVAATVRENPFLEELSTAGICLLSPSGKRYLTVASHAFQAGVGGFVYHPNTKGHAVGQISKVMGMSDISLADMADVKYSRETFSDPQAPVRPFGRLLATHETTVGEFIYLDTPFNGRCEGTLMKVEVRQIPSDEPSEDTQYIVGDFVYFGNGADILFEGSCGGVIWNENFDVLGQFRWQLKEGNRMCYCPSYQNLEGLGYHISSL